MDVRRYPLLIPGTRTLTPLSRPVTPPTRRYPWPTLLFLRGFPPDSARFSTAVTAGLADPGFRPWAMRGLG